MLCTQFNKDTLIFLLRNRRTGSLMTESPPSQNSALSHAPMVCAQRLVSIFLQSPTEAQTASLLPYSKGDRDVSSGEWAHEWHGNLYIKERLHFSLLSCPQQYMESHLTQMLKNIFQEVIITLVSHERRGGNDSRRNDSTKGRTETEENRQESRRNYGRPTASKKLSKMWKKFRRLNFSSSINIPISRFCC